MGRPYSVVVVGAGPTGISLVERVCANAPVLLGRRRLRIHVVDPYPPAGRVWRDAQSSDLWANSLAGDISMYPDPDAVLDGPLRPGPVLVEWAADGAPDRLADAALAAEAKRLHPGFFPSRRLLRTYLADVFDEVARTAPETVEVVTHRAHAVDLDPATGRVWLAGAASPLRADAVALAQGHTDEGPTPRERELEAFAAAHGATYLRPGYAADTDLDALRPGEPVITQGMGLAFVDYLVLLTQGRGGSFARERDGGRLRYHPSGREPLLLVGSRRGVPHRSKLGYRELRGPRPAPRHFTAEAVDALLARDTPVDFAGEVVPLIRADLEFAYYQELFVGHPDRVTRPWSEAEPLFASRTPGERIRAFVAGAVPDPADRLDLPAFERPLAGVRLADSCTLQRWMREHIAADLTRRHDPRHSADLGFFEAILAVLPSLVRVLLSDRLPARVRVHEAEHWLHDYYRYAASGPPGPRLEELLALSRAGVVRFLGAGTAVTADPGSGRFRTGGTTLPGAVTARAYIDARLPGPNLAGTRDPLLRALLDRGACAEETLTDAWTGEAVGTGRLAVDASGRVLGADGRPHAGLFATGVHVAGLGLSGFNRPGTMSVTYRRQDAMARALLSAGRRGTSGSGAA
jgi:uncharacterized NAD(P)/FAD-binding protein YdhS